MRDDVPFEGALVVVVEVLEALAGREPGGPDAVLAAVVLAGGDLTFETGGEELLMGPALGAGPLGRAGGSTRPATALSTPGTDTRGPLVGLVVAAAITPTPVARS